MNPPIPETSCSPSAAAKKPAVFVPHQPKPFQRVLAWLVYLCLKAIALTLRYRWHDGSNRFLHKHKGPAIYCVWHNRLALCLHAYFAYARPISKSPGIAAIVSASRDGAVLAVALEHFSVQPVRGSSSRRGPQALKELVTWAGKNYDLAITPDGPRGPRYKVQEGVISLAQLTSLPIIPFSYDLRWKISFNTWDRFQLPLPFSKCEMRIALPLQVPRESSSEDREKLRLELEKRLTAVTFD